MADTKKLAKQLHLDEVAIPAYSIHLGQKFLQHEESRSLSTHSLRYHVYLIPSRYDLKDDVTFAYGKSFAVIEKPLARSEE